MTSQARPADEPKASADATALSQPTPGHPGAPVALRRVSSPAALDDRNASDLISAGVGKMSAEADVGGRGPGSVGAEARNIPSEVEVGGRDGPDPTRYGDWELRGRCIDF